MQTQPDEDKEFSARTLRIFDMGHFIEDMIAGYLRRAGFELKTHDSQGKQFGFSVADEQIRGHIDGVICSGPVPMKYPFLWECKSSNSKKFNEFVRKGVAVANPVYAAQISLYQAYMDLTENPALFTVMNKDTSEIYYELIPFDKELAQKTSDRGVEILQATKAGEMLPRIAANSDYFTCKYCEFRKTCWS
jgi:CRISPR/Cas system-associated exonuclease Cas4 (RecB family)